MILFEWVCEPRFVRELETGSSWASMKLSRVCTLRPCIIVCQPASRTSFEGQTTQEKTTV